MSPEAILGGTTNIRGGPPMKVPPTILTLLMPTPLLGVLSVLQMTLHDLSEHPCYAQDSLEQPGLL